MDNVYLHGADDVRCAASTISSAAHEMRNAASSIDLSLERHQRFLDDWLQRLEAVLEKEASHD